MTHDLTIETAEDGWIELTPPRDGFSDLILEGPDDKVRVVRVKWADLNGLVRRAGRQAAGKEEAT